VKTVRNNLTVLIIVTEITTQEEVSATLTNTVEFTNNSNKLDKKLSYRLETGRQQRISL